MVQSGIGPGRDSNLRPLYRAIVVLSLCLTIRAQGVENITCPSLFLLSPTGVQPCLSLVRVVAACTEVMPLILPISQQPLRMYGPPSGDSVELGCQCTDVVYNLFSACTACQNGTDWYSHDEWFRPCPVDRPNMTLLSPEIINWNNHTYLPTFDVDTALAIARNEPPPEPSSSSTAVTTSGTLSTSASNKGSGTNLGAIIGGAVGGALFIAIVGFLIFFCMRRRKSRRVPPSAEFMKYAQSQGINNATVPLTNMSQEDDPRSSQSHGYAPPPRNSILYLNANNSTRSPSALGVSRNNTDEGDAPPAFTTGLFKDPIFEKGVALNLAGASTASGHSGPMSASPTGHGPNPLTQTPIAYSPASTMFHPDNQRLIHERQMSS